MKRELLMAQALRTPWAIVPETGEVMLGVLTRWQGGGQAPDEDLRDARAVREARDTRRMQAGGPRGGIAVIPVYGVIAPKVNLISDFSGGATCQGISSALREALADDAVSQILLDLDSPGGSVAGVSELASEIMQARTQKPIIGIANHEAGSAAYWLAACCTELHCSPSGSVGSIGVWCAHQDVSKAMENEGVKTTLVSAGRYKTEGNSFEPLSGEARDFIQSTIDTYYRSFVAAVARGRGVSIDTVRNGFGAGRMLTAGSAKAEGMVDSVTDFNSLVKDMQSRPRSSRTTRMGALSASTVPLLDQTAIARRRTTESNRRALDLLEVSSR
jgi:signal peptide peptidase SppA